jgi:hypothetical protein
MHLLIILALAIWIGVSLCKLNTRQSLVVIRTVGIIALVVIGLFAVLVVIGYLTNVLFAVYTGVTMCVVGVVGGLLWSVVRLGKLTKA